MIKEDILKLLYHQDADEISAVKEVKLQEQKLNPLLEIVKKDETLTSMHQAAAEVAVCRMKKFMERRIKFRRSQGLKITYTPEKAKSPGKINPFNFEEIKEDSSFLRVVPKRSRIFSEIPEEGELINEVESE